MKTCCFGKCWPFLCVAFLFFAGCGGAKRPTLGYVTGTVTMAGKPMGSIIVVMKPDVGRAAMVRANDEGYYEMEYVAGEKGTKVGPTTVTFEWPLGYAGPVAIPKKYTGPDSVYKIDVKEGDNKFDFDLEPDPGGAQPAVPVQD